MRNTRFFASALAKSLQPAIEEQAPDAGVDGIQESAAASQVQVQGADLDAVAQAQIEPVVAASGGQGTEGKPNAGEESTVEVPEVDSVAELQEQIGALEEDVYEADQQDLQLVSDQYKSELEEAADVVISLESLADAIDYSIANNQVNRSTNAAFYMTLMAEAKRSRIYTHAALEDIGDVDAEGDPGSEKAAKSIGDRVRGVASAAKDAVVGSLVKFLAWLQDVFAQFTAGAKGIIKKLEKFDAEKNGSLTGNDISSSVLIQRLRLVQGGGDAPAQFSNFTRYCSENLLKVLAGPVNQLLTQLQTTRGNTSNLQPINDSAIDRIISTMYPEDAPQDALRGHENIGSDWTIGATPALLGGLQAWIASNHNLEEKIRNVSIQTGISRDVPIDTPESIAGAQSGDARSTSRAMISILKHWDSLNLLRKVGAITGWAQSFTGKAMNNSATGAVEAAMGKVTSGDILTQYSQVLRAFCGGNTASLIRHMLYTFNLYHAYLEASARAGQSQEATAAAAA